jgi:hypothetical protein
MIELHFETLLPPDAHQGIVDAYFQADVRRIAVLRYHRQLLRLDDRYPNVIIAFFLKSKKISLSKHNQAVRSSMTGAFESATLCERRIFVPQQTGSSAFKGITNVESLLTHSLQLL